MFIKLNSLSGVKYFNKDSIEVISDAGEGSLVYVKSSSNAFRVKESPEEVMKLLSPKPCRHAWAYDNRGFHFCINCNQSRLP